MLNERRFREKCEAACIGLRAGEAEAFAQYAAYLCEYNAHTNLTAIIEPDDMENKHFLDSLYLAVQPEVRGSLLDVGAGAGFPGVPVKLHRPEVRVALLETSGKKAKFLAQLNELLRLDIEVIKMRAEDAAQKREYRETFEVVTARAVAQMNVLCEYCLPFVKVGGYFIAMKGGDAADEVREAAAAVELLGGRLTDERNYMLPDGAKRTLVLVRKEYPTPVKYPRNPAVVKKRPL